MCGRNLTIPAGSCDQSAKVESRKDVRVFSTPKLSKAVEVTGRGISEEDQEQIFGAFNQAAGQDHAIFGGTGLGLAIAREFVSLMQGTLELESEPGKGSRFTVCLPHVTAIGSPPAHRQTPKALAEPTVDLSDAVVLVADDVEHNRALLRGYLEPHGCEVIDACDGKEALDRVLEFAPDLILLDLEMPRMTGLEALQRLRADRRTRGIPVVVVTASVAYSDRTRWSASAAAS